MAVAKLDRLRGIVYFISGPHRVPFRSAEPLLRGRIPYGCKDPTDGRKPINAKCEAVVTSFITPIASGAASSQRTGSSSGREPKASVQERQACGIGTDVILINVKAPTLINVKAPTDLSVHRRRSCAIGNR